MVQPKRAKSEASAIGITWKCEAGGGGHRENQGSVTTPPQVQDQGVVGQLTNGNNGTPSVPRRRVYKWIEEDSSFVVGSFLKTDNCFALSKMARTKQTARKQLMPGMQTHQVEVSTSEDEQEEPVAKKKPRSKPKKREADSSGVTAEAPKSPPKEKKAAQKKKGETATTRAIGQKGKPVEKKRAPKTPKGKAASTSAEGGPKPRKERYIRPRYTDDMEPPEGVPPPKDRKRKVVVEYSTDDEVREELIDAAIQEGEYASIDVHKIKRIKKNVRLTLPPDPKVTDYPETFIVWYQEHGMTAGMRVALRGIGWTEEDIDAFKDRFIRRYGITEGYKLRYLGEALSEDDEPGKGGLADLIAGSTTSDRHTEDIPVKD